MKTVTRENGRGGIQAQITRWAKANSFNRFDYKKIPGGEFLRDEADTRVIHDDGHVQFIEVKVPGRHLTDGQKLYLQKLYYDYNSDIWVVYSRDEFIQAVQYYQTYRRRNPTVPKELEKVETEVEKQIKQLPRPSSLRL